MDAKQTYLSGGFSGLYATDQEGKENPRGARDLARAGVVRTLEYGNAGRYPKFTNLDGVEIWMDISTPLYMSVT